VPGEQEAHCCRPRTQALQAAPDSHAPGWMPRAQRRGQARARPQARRIQQQICVHELCVRCDHAQVAREPQHTLYSVCGTMANQKKARFKLLLVNLCTPLF